MDNSKKEDGIQFENSASEGALAEAIPRKDEKTMDQPKEKHDFPHENGLGEGPPTRTTTPEEKSRPSARKPNMWRLRTNVHRRRREKGEFPTASAAIRNHCLECVGYQTNEVRLCTAPKCWLYPWRFGMKPQTAAKSGETVDFS